jgi:nucleoside-diphosphate-sugar epimerase
VPITILRFGATADADELTNPHSVFARWLYLRAAIAHLNANPALDASAADSLRILRALDDGEDHVVVFADCEGYPEIRQWGDARDVAHGCARILQVPAAVGEVFNLGGLAPFAADELCSYIADRIGWSCVTARLPMARSAWYISSAKARGILGYAPQRTVFAMVDEAASLKTEHH